MPRLLLIIPTLLLLTSLILLVPALAQSPDEAPDANNATEPANDEEVVDLQQVPNAPRDAISYALGYRMGHDLREHGFELEIEDFTAGVRDAIVGDAEPRLDQDQLTAALTAFQQHMQAQAEQRMQARAEENRAFLEENAQREEVHVTDTGLQYRVIEAGPDDAPNPTPDQHVRVNYQGRLIDGQVFDDSRFHPEPTQFRVDQVIPGWTEALQLMRPGAKWEVFVPAELAYGERGTNRIPPHSTLVFEIEMLEIIDQPRPDQPAR